MDRTADYPNLGMVVSVRFSGDWRWLREREDSPWYPTARLFRQPAAGDWDSVLRKMAGELERFAADRACAMPKTAKDASGIIPELSVATHIRFRAGSGLPCHLILRSAGAA